MLRGASQRCFGGPIHTSAYVSIRQHASACVSIRQHTSAYVSMRQHTSAYVSIRQHTSAYVLWRTYARALEARLVGIEERERWQESYRVAALAMLLPQVRLHTSAYVSRRQRMGLRHSPFCCLKYACIRQHTSADVSVWGCGTRHAAASSTSAYVSIRQQTSAYGVAARLLQHIRR
jgi:hypothetical protein